MALWLYHDLGQLDYNEELRRFCDETNLCPDGFCCVWEQKQCISQDLMISSCNDISSSTTTTDDDVIPDLNCDAEHPCPQNYCCLWNSCLSQVSAKDIFFKIHIGAKLFFIVQKIFNLDQ